MLLKQAKNLPACDAHCLGRRGKWSATRGSPAATVDMLLPVG